MCLPWISPTSHTVRAWSWWCACHLSDKYYACIYTFIYFTLSSMGVTSFSWENERWNQQNCPRLCCWKSHHVSWWKHTSYQLQPAVMPSTHPNKCGGSVGFTFPNMVETTYGFCLKMGNIKNNVAIIGYSCLMRKTDLGISYAATGAMSKQSSFRFLVRISTVGRMTIPHK